jgi:hypothetical protein
MNLRIIGSVATGLLIAASATFAQSLAPPPLPTASPTTSPTPAVHGNKDKAQDHAEHHQQWEDCMRQQEAKYGGVKTVGPHAGANNKGNSKASSKGKPMPPDEKADAKKGEKENRHQAEMDDCREQLYGRDAPAPGKK